MDGAGAEGRLGVELWRDNGRSQPLRVGDADAKIADIGILDDVTQLPLDGAFEEVRFDNLGLEVEPDTPIGSW